MTGYAEPGSRQARNKQAADARRHARQAVLALASGSGGQAGSAQVRDAGPVAGLRAAHAIEAAARGLVHGYVRAAREDGRSWHEIGAALGLATGAGETVAEAAYRYATGPAGAPGNHSRGPSLTWRCASCGRLISDEGPSAGGPGDAERGHAGGCHRLTAAASAAKVGTEAHGGV